MSLPLNQPREAAEDRRIEAAGIAVAGGMADPAAAEPSAPLPIGQRPDQGLLSLTAIAAHYRIAADPLQLAHELGLGTRPAAGEDIARAATRVGLKSRLFRGQDPKRLASVPTRGASKRSTRA